VAELVDALD